MKYLSINLSHFNKQLLNSICIQYLYPVTINYHIFVFFFLICFLFPKYKLIVIFYGESYTVANPLQAALVSASFGGSKAAVHYKHHFFPLLPQVQQNVVPDTLIGTLKSLLKLCCPFHSRCFLSMSYPMLFIL